MDDTMRYSPFLTDNNTTQGAHTVFLLQFYLRSIIHITTTSSRLLAYSRGEQSMIQRQEAFFEKVQSDIFEFVVKYGHFYIYRRQATVLIVKDASLKVLHTHLGPG